MAGSATCTRVVSRLTRNAASSSAIRITGFDLMAEKLRQLGVSGGPKPPGVDRDAGGVAGPAQVDERGQRQHQQHPGVRVARGEELLAEGSQRAMPRPPRRLISPRAAGRRHGSCRAATGASRAALATGTSLACWWVRGHHIIDVIEPGRDSESAEHLILIHQATRNTSRRAAQVDAHLDRARIGNTAWPTANRAAGHAGELASMTCAELAQPDTLPGGHLGTCISFLRRRRLVHLRR